MSRRPTSRFLRPLALLPALLVATSVAACFVGYDSRWGQAKTAQQHLAAAATPSAIAASSDRPGAVADHTFRIRFRPNPHYLVQTVNAEEQIRQLVADADGVLRPAIGLHLEIDKIEPWSMNADDKLEPALAVLVHDDPGQDVDVVVGLVGALPAPTDDLHLAGYAEVLGKRLVVRAASRLGEHDMVDRALVELSDDEREKLVRARRRHRAEAVLLHELGHILGALHESQVASLMHPSYDPKAPRGSAPGRRSHGRLGGSLCFGRYVARRLPHPFRAHRTRPGAVRPGLPGARVGLGRSGLFPGPAPLRDLPQVTRRPGRTLPAGHGPLARGRRAQG